MSRYSDFVTDVTNSLEAVLTDTTFYPGEPPDTLPPASVASGYVWVETQKPEESNTLQAYITAGVRIYPIQTERFDGETPIDPAPIYDAASDVQASVLAGWEPGDAAVWFYEIMEIKFNHQEQYVDIEIRGTVWNDSAVGNN